MTTANVNIKKVLLRRGNTTQNNNYTGVFGEVSVDMEAKTLRIHDGNTVGGYTVTGGGGGTTDSVLRANVGAYQIYANANAAVQATAISSLNANIGAFQSYANITLSTIANAASQESAINSINANVGAYQIFANTNAASQATSINSINANIGAYQIFANANAASQTTEINSLRANITAANSAITSLTSNAAIQAALLDTLTGNAATQSTVLDTLTANAATQATTLTTLLSNAVAQQTSLIDLVANAAVQAQFISNTNANTKSYLAAFDGNIIPSANVTYSLGDSTHQWKDLWVSNNTIYIGNVPIRVDSGRLLVNNTAVADTVSKLTNGASTFQLFANGESRSPDTIFAANGVSIINANGAIQGGIYNSGDANFFNIGASTGRGFKFYVDEENAGPLFFANGSVNVPSNLYSAAGVIGDVSLYGGTISGTNPNWNYLTLTNQVEGSVFVQLPSEATANVANLRIHNDIGNIELATGDGLNYKYWYFRNDGNLTIPGNINYANGQSILSGIGGASLGDLYMLNSTTIANGMSSYLDFSSPVRLGHDLGNVQIIVTNQETSNTYEFTFANIDGSLNLPGNIISGGGQIQFIANSSGDGNGYATMRLIPDIDREFWDQYLIVDPTAPGHIHIRAGGIQDNSNADLILGGENSHVRVTAGSISPVYIKANSASWAFGVDSSLSMPTGGNLYFDNSAVSVIDGVTNINAVGTIGANVVQVLSDLTSFGASPAPRIYGFSSIATTGSAVNEGNISASGNLVASRNAYVTSDVFAARYNFANGVNILSTVGAGSYGNANVATYLPTYTGNIAANITKNGYRWNFGTDGKLTIPGTIQHTTTTSQVLLTENTFRFEANASYGGTYIEGQQTALFLLGGDGGTTIGANGPTWYFSANGNVELATSGSNPDRGIVFGDGTFQSTAWTGTSGNTGNVTFNNTTISTTGGAGQGIILNSAGSGEIAMLDYVGVNNTNPGYWLHIGDGAPGAVNNTGNISIDYNNGLDSSRASTIVGYAWWDAGGNGNNNRGIGAHRQFGIYKNDDLYTTKYLEIDLNSGNANLTNIAVSRVTTTNGIFWANGATFTSSDLVLGANIGSYQIYANANAASQQTSIDLLTSRVDQAVNQTSSPQFAGLTTTANVNLTANVRIHQNLVVDGNINFIGNVTQTNITTANAVFTGDSSGFGALYAGVLGYTPLPYTVIQATADYNDYSQINFQNLNLSANASTEWVATAGNGTDLTNYIDFGIAGGAWDGSQLNSVGTAAKANDGWVYVLGNTIAGTGGNLVLGTTQPGKRVNILTGGPGSGNIYSYFTSSGFTTANVSATNYLYANGISILTGISGTYSNTNVAGYLAGNISTGNINVGTTMRINGTTQTIDTANGSSIIIGSRINLTGSAAGLSMSVTHPAQFSSSLSVGTNSNAQSFYGTNYFYTNGVSILSGIGGTYSNTHVEAYIGGNIGAFQIFSNANSAAQATSINSINANIGAYQIYANANASTQATSIDTINANIGAYQIYANANASTQATSIDTLNANIGAFQTYANATFTGGGGGSTYSNTNVAAYLTTATVTTTGNVTAANLIATGNVYTSNIVTTGATSGNISGANYISANVVQISSGLIWANGTAFTSGTTYTSSGAGNITVSGSTLSLTATGPAAVAVGSSTAIPIITPDGYGRIASLSTAAVIAPAGTLSGTTLAATVVTSSLTSVGTLGSLTVTGNVSAGNVSVTQVTATTGAYSGNVTAANIITTGTYGNITGANVISANTVTVTTFVRTQAVAFAALPSATVAGAGARAFITDGNSATFAAAVSGSGANAVPVYSNGTNWFVG